MEKWLVTYTTAEDGVLWDSPSPQWSCEVEIEPTGPDRAATIEQIRALIAEKTSGAGTYVDATKVG
ncbi:hypothetical protein [Spirillospora sp. NPDC047279]|uniref:hypothetical protein n=1 Tax=Spirillospora sp. NPDC047279 TaxID=3155478 RepID=UPI0033D283BB